VVFYVATVISRRQKVESKQFRGSASKHHSPTLSCWPNERLQVASDQDKKVPGKSFRSSSSCPREFSAEASWTQKNLVCVGPHQAFSQTPHPHSSLFFFALNFRRGLKNDENQAKRIDHHQFILLLTVGFSSYAFFSRSDSTYDCGTVEPTFKRSKMCIYPHVETIILVICSVRGGWYNRRMYI
jgi:hypothetical protein